MPDETISSPRLARRANRLKPPEGAETQPDLFTAIQQQLGLKLESTMAETDVLVIDKLKSLRRINDPVAAAAYTTQENECTLTKVGISLRTLSRNGFSRKSENFSTGPQTTLHKRSTVETMAGTSNLTQHLSRAQSVSAAQIGKLGVLGGTFPISGQIRSYKST